MNPFAINIVAGLLTGFFIFASSIKILGWQKQIFEVQLAFFIKYGLNRLVMALVGAMEFAGAVILWSPGLPGILGVFLLFATSVGAIFFHLRFDTWKDGVPAMITAVLSGFLLLVKYQEYSAYVT